MQPAKGRETEKDSAQIKKWCNLASRLKSKDA
jgi:hypothetical protein